MQSYYHIYGTLMECAALLRMVLILSGVLGARGKPDFVKRIKSAFETLDELRHVFFVSRKDAKAQRKDPCEGAPSRLCALA